MQEVYEFLKNCGTYYLATVEGDQPRVRPFGTVDIFEGKLYIQTGKVKEVSKQIQANPKVELCAFADGKWLRVAGKLVRDDRVEAKSICLIIIRNFKLCILQMMTTPRSFILQRQQLLSIPLPVSQR